MRLIVNILFVGLIFGLHPAQAGDIQDLIETAFRNAIVKVDVSSNTPIFRDGVNQCNSEGTGFLLNSSYLITAEHVLRVDPRCGDPIVLLKSRKHNVAKLGKMIGFRDDIAIIKTEEPFPDSMCALRLLSTDVYNSKGIRIGIPAKLFDPASVPVKIGEQGGQFSPLVTLTPTATEFGESGGPVIVQFNVIGMLKARHQNYTAYSFMITGSKIVALMNEYHIKMDGRACNPVELNMYPSGDYRIKVNLTLPSGYDLSSDKAREEVLRKVKESLNANRAVLANVNVAVNYTIPVSGAEISAVLTIESKAAVGPTSSGQPEWRVMFEVATQAQKNAQDALWQAFIEEGTRANKWKD